MPPSRAEDLVILGEQFVCCVCSALLNWRLLLSNDLLLKVAHRVEFLVVSLVLPEVFNRSCISCCGALLRLHARAIRYFLQFLVPVLTYVEIKYPCYDRGICAILVARGVARNQEKINPS
jgi:hypothetical protein